jgi:hypothetical protein
MNSNYGTIGPTPQTKQSLSLDDTLDNEDITEVERMQVIRVVSSPFMDSLILILLFIFLGVFCAKVGGSLQFLSGLPGYQQEQYSLSAVAFFISHRVTSALELITVITILILNARLSFGLGPTVIYSIITALTLGAQITSGIVLSSVLYAYCNANNAPGNPCHDPSYCCKFYNTTLCGNLGASPCTLINTPSRLKTNPAFTELFIISLSLFVLQLVLYILVVIKMKFLATRWYTRIRSTVNNVITSNRTKGYAPNLLYHSPNTYNGSGGVGSGVFTTTTNTSASMNNNNNNNGLSGSYRLPLHKRIITDIAKKVELLAPTRLGQLIDRHLVSYLPHIE